MSIPGYRPSPEVAAALARGNKIEAIKLVRHDTGLGLAEAKDLVEALARQPAVTAAREKVTAAWSETVQAGTSGTAPAPLSPGEQPRVQRTALWVVVAVVVAAVLGFLAGRA